MSRFLAKTRPAHAVACTMAAMAAAAAVALLLCCAVGPGAASAVLDADSNAATGGPDAWGGTWTAPPTSVPSTGSVDGPLLGNGNVGVVLGGTADSLTFYVWHTSMWHYSDDDVPGRPDSHASNAVGLGGVTLRAPALASTENARAGSGGGGAYTLTQNISSGEIGFSVGSSTGITTLTGRSFLSQETGLMFTDLTVGGSAPLNVSFETWALNSSAGTARTGLVHGKSTAAAWGVWAARDTGSTVQPVSVAIATRILGGADPGTRSAGGGAARAVVNITMQPGTTVTMVTGVVSCTEISGERTTHVTSQRQFACPDPAPAAAELVKEVAGQLAADAMRAKTHAWWAAFWNASAVSLPSQPLLEAFWWRSLYVVACSNREGATAPGLWGAWVTTDSPNWHGDLTLNYNAQAPYYGIYSANHAELGMSYYDAILAYVPQGHADAATYNCSGVHYPGHIDPLGRPNHGDMGQHSDAAFAALNFVNHVRYTRDIDFLANVSYPFLKQVAAFWQCWLTRNTTAPDEPYRYDDLHDCTREGCAPDGKPNTNPSTSITFVPFILRHLVEASAVLDADPTLRLEWADIAAHIAPPPRGTFDSADVFLPQESPYYFKPQDNPLQLYAMYPGEAVGISSDPADVAAGINTVRLVDAWDQGNAFCETFPAAVRVGYPVADVISHLTTRLSTSMPPNGYVVEAGGGVETAGAMISVTEMLMQSWDGTLSFFPVWPKDEDASFRQLRAVGGFLVSASWVGSSRSPGPEGITVLSEAGLNCSLLSPWGQNIAVTRDDGSAVPVTSVGDGVYEFGTSAGRTYTVRAKSTVQRHPVRSSPRRAAAPIPRALPWYQTSINSVGLLWEYIGTGISNATTAKAALQSACTARDFVAVRFSATAFWPKEMNATYVADKAAYWQAFDALVADARGAGCRLIPSILWFTFLFSDIAGEPLQGLTREGSTSRVMLQTFTTELVSRYADDDTILAWELGNELNLMMDLNATQVQPGIAPQMGTPTLRTQADNISSADGVALYTDMAGWIRAADVRRHSSGSPMRASPTPRPRPISSGHALPRPSAEHLRKSYHSPQRNWTVDTQQQFVSNLLYVNSMADLVSVHYYPGKDLERFGATDPNSTALLKIAKDAVDGAGDGKVLYVGEFGEILDNSDPASLPPTRAFSRGMLDFFASECVPLSTVWVWDFEQSPGVLTNLTIVGSGRDDVYLAYTAQVNAKMRGACMQHHH